MKKREQIGLDSEVDKLTNSIENVVTDDSFATDITIISITDLKTVTKKIAGNLTGNQNLDNLKKTFTNLL